MILFAFSHRMAKILISEQNAKFTLTFYCERKYLRSFSQVFVPLQSPELSVRYCSTSMSVLEYLAFSTRVLVCKYSCLFLYKKPCESKVRQSFSYVWKQISQFFSSFFYRAHFAQKHPIFMFCNIYLSILSRILKFPKTAPIWKSILCNFSYNFLEKKSR